ncbi:hypothetical protein PENTCL1PPCAC_5152, partial [Pristionchus entomophagus]
FLLLALAGIESRPTIAPMTEGEILQEMGSKSTKLEGLSVEQVASQFEKFWAEVTSCGYINSD